MNLTGRNVVVTAHPDDETLWAGGLILRNPGDWTIICLTVPRRDPIRAWKFYEACRRLGAKAMLYPAQEPVVDEPLIPQVDVSGYDCLITHGAKGEYGHFHHLCVHAWAEGIDMPKVYFMGDERITLTTAEIAAKRRALMAYDHVSPSDGIPKWEALERVYAEHLDGTERFTWKQ